METQTRLSRHIKFISAESIIDIIFTKPLRSGRIWHKVNF